MSSENQTVDLVAKSLARVMPAALVTLLGSLLVLATGVLFLTEGAPLLRSAMADLPQPIRSISYLASLTLPMVVLCWSARSVMGYLVSRMTSHRRDVE